MKGHFSACVLVFVTLAVCTQGKIARKGPPATSKRSPPSYIDSKADKTPVNRTLFSSALKNSQAFEADFFLNDGLMFALGLSLGTPPQLLNFSVAMNSEFSYVKCSRCINCNTSTGGSPLFRPGSTYSRIPCNSSSCSGFDAAGVSTSCGSSSNSCSFNISYSSKFSTAGELATDILSMDSPFGGKVQANLTFGCGRDNGGFLDLINTSGLLGFDKKNKSFIGQLSRSYRSKFIYCLPSDTLRGKFVLGNYNLRNSSNMSYTPMITNPQSTELYYINLTSISVEGSTRQIPIHGIDANGTGGTIIDTTLYATYLTSHSYEELIQEVLNRTTKLVNVSVPAATAAGVELCYNISSNSTDYPSPQTLSYFFSGARIELPTWFDYDSNGVNDTVCLAVGRSETLGYSFNIIGTYQQLDMAVEYDLEGSRFGFGTQGCNASMVVNPASSARMTTPGKLMLFEMLLLFCMIKYFC